jgi:hypothetical protein
MGVADTGNRGQQIRYYSKPPVIDRTISNNIIMQLLKIFTAFIFILIHFAGYTQRPFTAGNIVVYRVGDGSTTLSGMVTGVYLDEYTPSGTLVQSIPMPVTGKKLTMLGRNEGGYLTLSNNGKYLVIPGWDLEVGTTPTSVVGINRSFALVDFNGMIKDVTVVTNNPGNTQPFSVVTDDASGFWISGGNRLDYVPAGSSTATSIATLTVSYALAISAGQLYVTTNNITQPVLKVGNGLPTSVGQTVTPLPGIPDRTSPRQFAFADLDPAVPGMDVLYLASQSGTTGGIQKYSLVNGNWFFNGVVGTPDDFYGGLTIKIAANVVTIFATRKGNNTTAIKAGELISLTDNNGYNGSLSGTPTVLAAAAGIDKVAFRGVALVPQNCGTVDNLNATNVTPSAAAISWNAGSGNYEYAVTTSSTPPASGMATTNNAVALTGLTNATTYYAHVRSMCGALYSSNWSTITFETGCKPPSPLSLQATVSPGGSINAKWFTVAGAINYEYAVSTNAAPPASGTATTDTTCTVSNLNSLTQYYLHVRSSCGSGSWSDWVSKPFTTGCFMPAPVVAALSNAAGVKWNTIANAVRYEFALTYSVTKPLNGIYTTDTTYAINKVNSGIGYYFHIRAICNGGKVSEWSTTPFNAQGLRLYPSPFREMLYVQWKGIVDPSAHVVIGDAMGRTVARLRLNNNTASVNTSSWPAGVYIARYQDGKNDHVVRVLKQ